MPCPGKQVRPKSLNDEQELFYGCIPFFHSVKENNPLRSKRETRKPACKGRSLAVIREGLRPKFRDRFKPITAGFAGMNG
jgi:hypothetical protein